MNAKRQKEEEEEEEEEYGIQEKQRCSRCNLEHQLDHLKSQVTLREGCSRCRDVSTEQ